MTQPLDQYHGITVDALAAMPVAERIAYYTALYQYAGQIMAALPDDAPNDDYESWSIRSVDYSIGTVMDTLKTLIDALAAREGEK